jgi:hypothetical protein
MGEGIEEERIKGCLDEDGEEGTDDEEGALCESQPSDQYELSRDKRKGAIKEEKRRKTHRKQVPPHRETERARHWSPIWTEDDALHRDRCRGRFESVFGEGFVVLDDGGGIEQLCVRTFERPLAPR